MKYLEVEADLLGGGPKIIIINHAVIYDENETLYTLVDVEVLGLQGMYRIVFPSPGNTGLWWSMFTNVVASMIEGTAKTR